MHIIINLLNGLSVISVKKKVNKKSIKSIVYIRRIVTDASSLLARDGQHEGA